VNEALCPVLVRRSCNAGRMVLSRSNVSLNRVANTRTSGLSMNRPSTFPTYPKSHSVRRQRRATAALSPVRLATSESVMLGVSREKLVSTLKPLTSVVRCSRDRSALMLPTRRVMASNHSSARATVSISSSARSSSSTRSSKVAIVASMGAVVVMSMPAFLRSSIG